ncbi:MAG: C1 family peptidase, partial [Agathobacter sp.]|nr:C1 family peptidase [Agathobacter sp.]
GMMIDVDEETEDIGDIDSLSSNDNSLDDVDGPDIISAANDEISISDDGEDNTSDIGTFNELGRAIWNSESNLTLEKDYNFTDVSSTSGIRIYDDLTINGNGHYIDSQGLSRIFNINGTTLILNNIVFISSQGADAGYSSLDIEGGTIFAFNSNLVIENCSFDSFNANFGGAICALDTNLTLNNVSFSNCSSKYYGGAVYQMYGNLNASSSSFANCSAIDGAGIFADDLDSVNISNTGFYENNASLLGGAIFSNENENMIIEDCTFDSNTAAYYNKSYVDDSGDAHVLNYYGENLVADASGYTGYDVYNQAKYDLYIFYDNDYELFYNDGTILNEFPESYDLRNVSNVSFVTNVKNQGNGGNCWSFSAMAALESAILKATNGAVSLDLSEENMKNLMACFSPFGTTYETNTGGNDRLSNAYLAAGLGPVLESLDNYIANDYLSAIFNPLTHIQNILWIDRNDYLDNDGIKFALLNYGAVSVSCNFDRDYRNGANHYYYGSEGRNHAVTIVGWNDTYSASNFKTTPPGDGAWIVKNSWGTGSGDKGYYYVSYYDTRFAIGHQECFCFVLNNSVKYRKTYQYDIVGMSDWLYNESASNGVWYKNVFNSTDDEVLAAFSTYFNEKTNYTAYVYVNDELVNVQNGSASNGYFTIKLSKYIPLKKGDKFEIVMSVRSDKISLIPISESTASKRDYAIEGVSFFSFDGESWEDLYNYSGEYYENGNRTHWYNLTKVACLKAFTISKAVVNLTVQTPIDFRAIILDEFGDLVNYGLFNITNGDREYLIDASTNLTIAFNEKGTYRIFYTKFNDLISDYDFDKTIEIGKLNVVAFPTSVSFEDNLLENYSTHLNVSVIDCYGNPVPDGVVSFEILDSNGDSVLNHTLNMNDLSFDCYLDPGVYRILFKFTSSNDNYLNASLNGSFKVRNLTSISLNLNDIIYGEIENITSILNINGVDLTYVINGSNGYEGVFNSSDSLILSDLDVGIYDVHVRFNGNEDYAHNSTSGSFVVGQRPSGISYSYAK